MAKSYSDIPEEVRPEAPGKFKGKRDPKYKFTRLKDIHQRGTEYLDILERIAGNIKDKFLLPFSRVRDDYPSANTIHQRADLVAKLLMGAARTANGLHSFAASLASEPSVKAMQSSLKDVISQLKGVEKKMRKIKGRMPGYTKVITDEDSTANEKAAKLKEISKLAEDAARLVIAGYNTVENKLDDIKSLM